MLGAISLVVSALSFHPVVAQQHINGGDSTEVNGKIVTHLAGHTLTIPKGYIDAFMGFAQNLMLKAALPCLEPKTPTNTADFAQYSMGRIVTINLNPFADAPYRVGQDQLKMHQEMQQAAIEWLKTNHPDSAEIVDAGPISIPGSRFVRYRNFTLGQDVFVLPDSNPLFLIACRESQCEVHEKIGDFHVWYWFDRTFVANIDEAWTIDMRIHGLLQSFLTNTNDSGCK